MIAVWKREEAGPSLVIIPKISISRINIDASIDACLQTNIKKIYKNNNIFEVITLILSFLIKWAAANVLSYRDNQINKMAYQLICYGYAES